MLARTNPHTDPAVPPKIYPLDRRTIGMQYVTTANPNKKSSSSAYAGRIMKYGKVRFSQTKQLQRSGEWL